MTLNFRLSLPDQFALCGLLIVLRLDAISRGHIDLANEATEWVNRIAGTNHPLLPVPQSEDVAECGASRRERAFVALRGMGEVEPGTMTNLSDSRVQRIILVAREAELGVRTTVLHRRMAAELPVETLHFVATGGAA